MLVDLSDDRCTLDPLEYLGGLVFRVVFDSATESTPPQSCVVTSPRAEAIYPDPVTTDAVMVAGGIREIRTYSLTDMDVDLEALDPGEAVEIALSSFEDTHRRYFEFDFSVWRGLDRWILEHELNLGFRGRDYRPLPLEIPLLDFNPQAHFSSDDREVESQPEVRPPGKSAWERIDED